ncbi:6-bladed beta-propeller, partial [Gemmatimonadota bacterium]
MKLKSTLSLVLLLLMWRPTSSQGIIQDPEHRFRVSIDNGVIIAENNGVPKYSVPLFTIENPVHLNQDDSIPESLLYRVYRYQLGDDGRFYVADVGQNRIVVYDATGNYLFSFGRTGDGPGEFRAPTLRWIRNGQIVVDDDDLDRISLWNSDGSFVDFFSPTTKSSKIIALFLTPEFDIIEKARETEYSQDRSRVTTNVLTIYRPDGGIAGSISASPNHHPPTIEAGGRMMFFTGRGEYYGPISDCEYFPRQGILVHNSAEPELKWFNPSSALSRIVSTGLKRENVSSEERRSVFRMLDRRTSIARNAQTRALSQAQRDNAKIAEFKALWKEIIVDDEGYCWLKVFSLYGEDPTTEISDKYRVYSPEGEYLGDAYLPGSLVSICQGHVLTIQEDMETGSIELIAY